MATRTLLIGCAIAASAAESMQVPTAIGMRSSGCTDRGGYTDGAAMPLTVLDQDEAARRRARCLDGSAPGFYHRNGSDSRRWVVYLKGGGMCYTDENCLASARSPYGGTTSAPPRFGLDGILSTDAAINPTFAKWQHVLLWYCDASSWGSDRKEPHTVRDPKSGELVSLYHEGFNVSALQPNPLRTTSPNPSLSTTLVALIGS